jgi:hypothetical protein
MEEKQHVDFNAWVDILTRLTARAQATFLNLYIKQMGPSLCRSVIRYCHRRLDTINSTLPKDSLVIVNGPTRFANIQSNRFFADDETLN